MTRHLAACAKRRQAIARAEGKETAASETLFHLRVQDAGSGEFWLDLEMRGGAALQALDRYLRAIWLECCGHMSQFSIGGWRGEEISMRRRADAVFQPGVVLTHIYDFGTSTETLVTVAGVRQGRPTTPRPLALLARNLMPEAECMECEQPAAWLCIECVTEGDVSGALCATHAEGHPHDDYGEPVPLVNSPRVGVCGYTGPAEPPY